MIIELECLNSALEKESREKLKIKNEKDESVTKVLDLEKENGKLLENIYSLEQQMKNLIKELQLKDKSNSEMMQEKDETLVKARI